MLRSIFDSLLKQMSRSPRRRGAVRRARAYRPEFLNLESRTLLSTFTWLRPVSGDWDDPANWAGGQVPGVPGMPGVPDTTNADVIIPFQGITVTHAASTSRIVVSLVNEANLDISAGSLQLRGGTGFAGGDKPSRTDGLIHVTGSGTLTVGDSHAEFGVVLSGAGGVQNSATLNLNVLSTLAVPVDNEAGVLNDGGNITQAFTNGPSARLHIPGDVTSLASIAHGFTNQGWIDFTGDIFEDQVASLTVPSGTVVNAPGATIDFNANGNLLGSVDNQGTITVEGIGGLGMSGGTVTNEGTITVTPSLRLEGSFGVSDSAFTNSGTITVNGFRSSMVVTSQAAFTNTGTITVTGPAALFDVVGGTFSQAGTLSGTGTVGLGNITATLTPDAIGAVAGVSVGGSTITSASPLTNLSFVFNSTINGDVVNSRGGINPLAIAGNSTINGAVTNASGAGLSVSGSATFNGDVTNAQGAVLTATGNATVNGNLTNAPGATLNVDGTLALAQRFTNDGTISEGVIGDPNNGLDPTVGFLTVPQNLTNNGTLVLVNGDITVPGGTLTNAPGATISMGDGVTDNGTGTRTLHAALDNQGTLAVKVGASFTGTVSNSGTVDVQTGDLSINPPEGGPRGALFTNTGTLLVRSLRAIIVDGGGDFANSGTVSLTGFGSVVVTGSYTQTAGSTQLNSGLLTVDGLVDLEGGLLAGTGVINAGVLNNAEVDVGQPGSPGVLTIVGDYTQTSGGVLVMEIGGLLPGTDFGQLNVTGQATLDGTLTVHLTGGFVPSSGSSFAILTFGSASGVFATLNGDGGLFTPSFGATDVTLVAN
jgi:hypothetical protein